MNLRKHRKLWAALLSVLLFAAGIGITAPNPAKAMSGAGTPTNPYVIMTASDLDSIRNNLTAYYKLGADIDLSSFDAGDGNGWMPIGNDVNKFQGTLDGNYHTITGLNVNRGTSDFGGLFGYALNATIINLALTDFHVKGKSYVGAVAGVFNGVGLIDKVYADNSANYPALGVEGTSKFVGGLVGRLDGTISQSYSMKNNVKGYSDVGGLVGRGTDGKIFRAYAYGSVTATKSVDPYPGGLVGSAAAGTVVESYWATDVSGQATSQGGTGVLASAMLNRVTFANWDFEIEPVWENGGNTTTPRLVRFNDIVPDGFISDLFTNVKAAITTPDLTQAAKPAYLTPIDTQFGTTITRIGGDASTGITFSAGGTGVWGNDARHHYSRDQPWSSDGSLIALQNRSGGSPTNIYLDGSTYEPKYGTCVNYNVRDDRWHPSPSHPHERINVNGTVLSWFDVTTCTETKHIDLPFTSDDFGQNKGNPSNDGRYVVLTDLSGHIYAVDMQTETVGPATDVTDCDDADCSTTWVSISPSGNYAVVNYSANMARVYDVDKATLTLTLRPMPVGTPTCSMHDPTDGYIFDLGHADMTINPFDNDEDVIVGQWRNWCPSVANGEDLGHVVMVRLSDGKVTSLTDPTAETPAHHISGQNIDRPGWVYVSYQTSSTVTPKRFNNEIVAIKLDGSKDVERFATTHTTASDYRIEAHGVPSRDGTRVMFASGWDQQCSVTCGTYTNPQAYVMDARP